MLRVGTPAAEKNMRENLNLERFCILRHIVLPTAVSGGHVTERVWVYAHSSGRPTRVTATKQKNKKTSNVNTYRPEWTALFCEKMKNVIFRSFPVVLLARAGHSASQSIRPAHNWSPLPPFPHPSERLLFPETPPPPPSSPWCSPRLCWVLPYLLFPLVYCLFPSNPCPRPS